MIETRNTGTLTSDFCLSGRSGFKVVANIVIFENSIS